MTCKCGHDEEDHLVTGECKHMADQTNEECGCGCFDPEELEDPSNTSPEEEV